MFILRWLTQIAARFGQNGLRRFCRIDRVAPRVRRPAVIVPAAPALATATRIVRAMGRDA